LNELGGHVERHRRELLIHCYRMLGSFPDAEDAVQETLLRAWRYRDSVKKGAPLRPWLYRVATNVCLDAIARDERRAVLNARAEADEGWAGRTEDVVFTPDNFQLFGLPIVMDPAPEVNTWVS
jgi:RNA polymerase sigma-70 factor (ECF subfamily)